MMMYRQCTTIGMNKEKATVKEVLLIVLCFAIALGIRIFLAVFGEMVIADDLNCFQSAVIQENATQPLMTSGVIFAYTERLSDVFRFTGNRPEAAIWYHILLQTITFFFLFFGCSLLFGKVAAYFESAAFAVSPWVISATGKATPESFYLLWWSFLFLLVGIFAKKTRDKGWHRKNMDEIFLATMGFLAGMLCIWHVSGFLLLTLIVYSMISNLSYTMEKRNSWKKASAMERLLMEDQEENGSSEAMPVLSEIMLLTGGILLGAFCTLMKYTGVTGWYIKDQFLWWIRRIARFENGRIQDLEIWLFLWLMITICAGAVLQSVLEKVMKNKEEKPRKESKKAAPFPEGGKMEKKKEEKNVRYLDNPLPLPKKHVKRKLDFELDKKDGFDIEIDENDDFDI